MVGGKRALKLISTLKQIPERPSNNRKGTKNRGGMVFFLSVNETWHWTTITIDGLAHLIWLLILATEPFFSWGKMQAGG